MLYSSNLIELVHLAHGNWYKFSLRDNKNEPLFLANGDLCEINRNTTQQNKRMFKGTYFILN